MKKALEVMGNILNHTLEHVIPREANIIYCLRSNSIPRVIKKPLELNDEQIFNLMILKFNMGILCNGKCQF